ncbi:hypothetical protein SAMN03159423_5162 [Bradyrhizobium sp. NFR13]|uniref:hypothetical protein n=1 Tax=Bradyrhizobium sp. NFR13 TaxID=1566285 RepID=UPI0008EC81EC|nr:hypothetical protein [Bradyrhizobium sp. NFR13]SFM06130.1 hypothetical protein SAMN03159423_5162 [Bradyrhizobium sp. NFR13]
MRKRRRNKISGQFSAHLVEMIESPAWMVASLSCRRVLDRIEIEHAHHGGNDNGRLPVTFNQFHEYGIHRHSIAPGIREAVALGLLVVTVKGRAGNAEHRAANLFRLTYRDADGLPGDGTHEWRRIATVEEAEQIAADARKEKATKKTQSRWRKMPSASDENRHRKPVLPVMETITTNVAKTITTSISRIDTAKQTPREARPSGGAEASGAAGNDHLALLQAAVAQRLGRDGWQILQSLDDDGSLNDFLELEQRGQLNDAGLAEMRLKFLKAMNGAAA